MTGGGGEWWWSGKKGTEKCAVKARLWGEHSPCPPTPPQSLELRERKMVFIKTLHNHAVTAGRELLSNL